MNLPRFEQKPLRQHRQRSTLLLEWSAKR